MHPTALSNADYFFKAYLKQDSAGARIVEIGSQDVNGSLRSVCPRGMEYIGVDFIAGKGVDIVLTDPYQLPFDDNSVDFCVSSSVFEHAEMFWVLFIEILRILKPNGLFYLNSPSNGQFHRFPVDCWRFYPDSGTALVNWAKRCNMNAALLESYISLQKCDRWNDFVAVFLKDAAHIDRYPNRIIDTNKYFYNGLVYGSSEFLQPQDDTEDYLKRQAAIAAGCPDVGGIDRIDIIQSDPPQVLITGWAASKNELSGIGIMLGDVAAMRVDATPIDSPTPAAGGCTQRHLFRFQAGIAIGDIPPSITQINVAGIRSDTLEFLIMSVPFQLPAILGNIDLKKIESGNLVIEGWAIGASEPPLIRALDMHGQEIARADTGLSRSDVATAWPAWPGAAASGFKLCIPGVVASAGDIQVLADNRRGHILDLSAKKSR